MRKVKLARFSSHALRFFASPVTECYRTNDCASRGTVAFTRVSAKMRLSGLLMLPQILISQQVLPSGLAWETSYPKLETTTNFKKDLSTFATKDKILPKREWSLPLNFQS
jgi:hypothetical protein